MDWDHQTLAFEVQDARAGNRDHLHMLRERIELFHGPSFSQRRTPLMDPTNSMYQYVSFFLPEVASGVPRYTCRTHFDDAERVVDALEESLNAVAIETRMRESIQALAVDYCLVHFGAVVYPKRRPQADHLRTDGKDAYWPTLRRLEADHLIWDQSRILQEDWRFSAHLELHDIQTLRKEEDAGWDFDELENSTWSPQDYDTQGAANLRDQPRRYRKDIKGVWVVHGRQATGEDVKALGYEWKDEWTPENGYNGVLFYLPFTPNPNRPAFVRAPQPFFGPADGPHVYSGGMPVPGDSFKLSNLTANHEQMRELGDYERATNDSGKNYKRVVVYDEQNEALAEMISSAQHDGVWGIPGVNTGNWAQWEFGGVTQQNLVNLERLHNIVDRGLGFSDESRGNTSDSTATAASIAAASTGKRMGLQVSNFVDGLDRVARKMAWWMWHDERFVVGIPGGEVVEGGVNPSSLVHWEDVAINTEFYSIQHTTEALQRDRFAQTAELATGLFPALPQLHPYVNVPELLEALGELGNNPTLDRLVKMDGLEAVAQLLLQAQLPPQEPEPTYRIQSRRPSGMAQSAQSGGRQFGRPGGVQRTGYMPQSAPSDGSMGGQRRVSGDQMGAVAPGGMGR